MKVKELVARLSQYPEDDKVEFCSLLRDFTTVLSIYKEDALTPNEILSGKTWSTVYIDLGQ